MVEGVIGSRIFWISERNDEPSNVKAAPRRAWAWAGSGMADNWARVRWYPSMGMKPAIGGREVLFE